MARIKVLGSGCCNCQSLEESVVKALQQLNREETIEHISDFIEIAKYGVMSTPALVLDEQVVSFGKVLSVEDIIHIMKEVQF